MLRNLRNKILTMIQRCVVSVSGAYAPGEYPIVQVEAMGSATDMESLSPYGFASMPPAGSSGIKMNLQGESSKPVGIVRDLKTVPPHNSGEVVIGAFSAAIPTYLKFTQAGTIEVWKNGVLVISDLITHVHTGVTTGAGLSGPPAL